jgi:ankyrin repeat protein
MRKRCRRLLAKNTDDHGPRTTHCSLASIPEDGVFELHSNRPDDITSAPPASIINMSVNRNKLNWEWRLTATTSIGQKNRLNSFTPLQIASWLSNTRAASLLLQRGVLLDLPDHFGSTPLHSATCTGKTDAITLLRAGANPNIQDVNGETPAYAAAQLGHLTTLQILVKTAPMYISQTLTVKLLSMQPLRKAISTQYNSF